MYNEPIFSIFKEKKINNVNYKKSPRQTRSDKTYPRKFPVTDKEEIILRNLYQIHRDALKATSITHFLTMLLRYGLMNPALLNYNFTYEDTGKYKTVKPNRIEKDMLSGLDGLAIKWGYSERKAIHKIIFNVVEHLKRGGTITREEVQPLKSAR